MVTEELIDYIKKEIEKGFSLDAIKQQLLSQNVLQQDIDEAIEKATIQQSTSL
jgi:SOS response regulatory protein OraA/RecX